ncbi:hypothetical protein J5N97_013441 [Dioscorea zingiberensis]|uniref:VQ domain-containing protein n=1 Tax=Dioscorea zingiberensis TaxID=325984 RepID=A0A9D5CT03_9LILI|nr:hypothetical protein J5N97_013441 [Dioscorea zingiberensis]
MDRAGVHQNKAQKKGNTKKKKEIKVVYISNPMKFQTSAANFRELVQKVTGQDSDIANMPDTTLFNASQDSPGSSSGPRQSEILSNGNESQLGTHDDAFAESWSAFVPPSMFYEPPQSVFRPRSDQV